MSRPALEQAKAAWARQYDGLTQEEVDQRVLGFSALVRGIAAKGAVTPEDFSRDMSLSPEVATAQFSSLSAYGLERDDEGRIVGAALTTRPTPHSLSIPGRTDRTGRPGRTDRQLFAWRALDTLFIPGLLGEVAEVASTCPVSDTPVRLSVTPEGVQSVDPPGIVLSVVLPGAGSLDATVGPASPT